MSMDKTEVQLSKVMALIEAVDSDYITQSELEDVVALIIKAFSDKTDEFEARLKETEGNLSEKEQASFAQSSKTIQDLKKAVEARLEVVQEHQGRVMRETVQSAIDTALSRIQAMKGDKGDQGIPGVGVPGPQGPAGSPDTPDEVTNKVNQGAPLIKKERVEGLADIERMAKANSNFNPTMGPSFADLESIRTSVTALSRSAKAVSINYIIDGGGSAITTGVKGFVEIPYDMTITGWEVFADQSGSVVVDVWRSTYAGFPPVVGGSIAGSQLPTLSSTQNNQNLSLTTWTTSLSKGDIIAYNVNSASTVTRITVSLIGTKN